MVDRVFRSRNSPSRHEVWNRFLQDEGLIKAHRITSDEIASLRTFVPFAPISDTGDILFVLNQVRTARGRR